MDNDGALGHDGHNFNGPAMLYRNNGASGNHWIKIGEACRRGAERIKEGQRCPREGIVLAGEEYTVENKAHSKKTVKSIRPRN